MMLIMFDRLPIYTSVKLFTFFMKLGCLRGFRKKISKNLNNTKRIVTKVLKFISSLNSSIILNI